MCSLKELAEFIKVTDDGLQREVKEGDYEGLVFVMGNLFAVRERQATTDEMFEPLKQTIELLKTYDQEMPEEVHLQLQVLVCLSLFPFHAPRWCLYVDTLGYNPAEAFTNLCEKRQVKEKKK